MSILPVTSSTEQPKLSQTVPPTNTRTKAFNSSSKQFHNRIFFCDIAVDKQNFVRIRALFLGLLKLF